MPEVVRNTLKVSLMILLMGNSFSASSEQPRIFEVSLVSLIANPEKYEGQRIAVAGFLHIEFEGTAIYLHQDDYVYGISQNGIWVFLPENLDSISDFPGSCQSNRYVQIVGRFSSKFKGHMGAWGGSIQNTESCSAQLRAN